MRMDSPCVIWLLVDSTVGRFECMAARGTPPSVPSTCSGQAETSPGVMGLLVYIRPLASGEAVAARARSWGCRLLSRPMYACGVEAPMIGRMSGTFFCSSSTEMGWLSHDRHLKNSPFWSRPRPPSSTESRSCDSVMRASSRMAFSSRLMSFELPPPPPPLALPDSCISNCKEAQSWHISSPSQAQYCCAPHTFKLRPTLSHTRYSLSSSVSSPRHLPFNQP
mmetsp:Transcript_13820/g.39142  ORF Transcript_13820/g.39142 Transcript_13820/m.39142 type:complete len:222 (+) Transcript_13820:220-885(+)